MIVQANRKQAEGLRASSSNSPAPLGQTEGGLPRLAYSVKDASQALNVSPVTIYRLLASGLLKSSMALRHKRIPVSELERLLRDTLN